MEKWTIDNIPDLTGKIVVVTGGNSGIGYETVRVSALKGAEVIMASRSVDRAEAALAKIQKKQPDANISIMRVNLVDLDDIKRFAEEFSSKYSQLHYLFNNAGIMMVPQRTTPQGHELQFGTNHLGHYALTAHLLPVITATPGSRVITISSNAHKRGIIDFDDMEMKEYDPAQAYNRSKVANLHFTLELQRRFEEHGIDATSVGAHPGLTGTNLATQENGMITNRFFKFLTKVLMPMFTMSISQGALPQLRAAYDSQSKGGEYYGPHKGRKGNPVLEEPVSYARDETVSKQLWEVSEQLTGATFNF
ncbi:MAG: oxidoreductase [Candidatus Kariarchaeaceae archaeon]|jgi:NAD(P)-dependent dehydrogenase (short-subunit alcohol dehydrogenase family)